MEELRQELEKLKKEIEILKQRRVSQSDVIPSTIKSRHIGEGVPYLLTGLATDLPAEGFLNADIATTSVYFAYDTDTLYIWNGSAWVSEVLT